MRHAFQGHRPNPCLATGLLDKRLEYIFSDALDDSDQDMLCNNLYNGYLTGFHTRIYSTLKICRQVTIIAFIVCSDQKGSTVHVRVWRSHGITYTQIIMDYLSASPFPLMLL